MIRNQKPDILLLGGDTSDSRYLVAHLQLIETELKVPTYFVLGNHDFYHGSISQIQKNVMQLTRQSVYLAWLTSMDIVELTPSTALIGHDSWADGRYGDYYRSSLMLNDYFLIKELTNLNQDDRLRMLHRFGDAAANHFKKLLPLACQSYREILLLTHVPPFREACWHEGHLSDDEGLPHFSCKAVGEVLLEVMQAHPACNLTVLCGHTHSSGIARILPNLMVFTGEAEYGKPQVQRVFEIE
jgi:predicted MPP superfamily phosphohydrolase